MNNGYYSIQVQKMTLNMKRTWYYSMKEQEFLRANDTMEMKSHGNETKCTTGKLKRFLPLDHKLFYEFLMDISIIMLFLEGTW